MNKTVMTWMGLLLMAVLPASAQDTGKKWTLQECIDYALEHNIQLKKNEIQRLSAEEDVLQSKAELLPSLNASTNQSAVYRPFISTGQNTVANGYVQSSIDKVYYNGSYGVNANWVVWNGNRNKNTIKLNEITAQKAQVDSVTTARSIEERIVQLYVQILYTTEAIEVSKQSLETSKLNEQRGQTMVEVGKMSRADLAQLTAQRAQDEYNIVVAESNVKNFKFQLKQLLELTDATDFDVVIPQFTDAQALEEIPALNTVYMAALDNRPEIKSSLLAIESSEVSIDIARAGKSPTVSLSGSAGTNTTSMSEDSWTHQLKTNFDFSVGATLSIPILDNRQTKTAINKARLSRELNLLDLKDKQHHRDLLDRRHHQPEQVQVGTSGHRQPAGQLRTAQRAVPARSEKHHRTDDRQDQPGAGAAKRAREQVHHHPQHLHAQILPAAPDGPVGKTVFTHTIPS